MKINSVALILGILFLACLMITPVMAETLTGTLGTTGLNTTSSTHIYQATGGAHPAAISNLFIKDIHYTSGLAYLIRFDITTPPTFTGGSPVGNTTPVIFKIGANQIGTGTFGYQRLYNGAGVETLGYQYLIFNSDWNGSTTYTGNQAVTIEGLPINGIEYAIDAMNAIDPTFSGGMKFGTQGNGWFGNYSLQKNLYFQNQYTATKPSGLGITGVVNKSSLGGTIYTSRAWLFDGVTGVALTGEPTLTGTNFNFATGSETIKIGVQDSLGAWYNSTILFNVTAAPTPTPTPIAGGIYTLSTNTDYVNVSGTNIATISSFTDPTLTDLKFISFGYSDSTNADTPFNEVGSTINKTAYTKIGGTWYGYDSADVDYNNAKSGIPNPLTLKWDTSAGVKTLHVTVQNTAGDYTYLTRTITVGQGVQNLIETKCQAMDGTNGGSIGMVSMQIYNHNTGTWTNLSPNDGLGTIITPANTVLSFYAQKAGFTDGILLNQPARADLIYSINLFSGPAAPSGYVNYYVTVKDAGGYSIPGAQITIITGGSSKLGTSSQYGGAQIFNLTNSTLYTWTVIKTGYSVRSGSFTTPTSGSGTLEVVMYPLVTPTRTTVPIPTGSWTIAPGTTPFGNGTFWNPWKNVFTMMGASNSELPMLIAGLIIVLCMAAGAGMAGVLGAEVMMGFGAIFCVALGLIPIWVVLAIIILGFLFYGLKVVR